MLFQLFIKSPEGFFYGTGDGCCMGRPFLSIARCGGSKAALRGLLALAWLTLALPLAAETDPEVLMNQGIDAHEAGATDQAIGFFEQAREAGLNSDALHYNMGVAYYRAGRLAPAAQSFERLLASAQLAHLARYNLGLVALAENAPGRAREHFQQVLNEAGQDRLRTLAGRQLERMEGDKPSLAVAADWQGALSLAAGFEDNVELASDRALAQGDAFGELFGVGSGYLAGDADAGWLLSGLFIHRQFRRSPQIRQSQMRAGLARDQRAGGWLLRLGVEVDHARLGGDPQDSQFRLQGRAQRPLGAGRWQVQASATPNNASSRFGEYDGQQWVAGTAVSFPLRPGMAVGLGYRYEANRREDLQWEQDFFSISPRRHRLQTRFDLSLGQHLQLFNTLEYRLSQFRDREQREGETLSARREQQWRLQSRLERSLAQDTLLFISAQWERNQANFRDRDYRRLEALVGLEWRY
ncbi:MAG: hypothetical protein EA349_14770 [Halomonadaceae bacterium]|nr:MAG: hypothetical protein EA349_14770 [Halomonadaceae bacterium]